MRNILFSNIFFYIFTKNVIASFSGDYSEFEDYYFEGSSEGSSDLRDFSLDYQGQDRHLSWHFRVVGKSSWKKREIGKQLVGKSDIKLERMKR